jgi:hypothetical protein
MTTTQDLTYIHHKDGSGSHSELHSTRSRGDSHAPLIHHPTNAYEAAQWKRAAHVNLEHPRYLPSLEITNSYHHKGIEGAIERSKTMVAFGKSSEVKLAAAHALMSYGVADFNMRDRHGVNQHYRIENFQKGRLQVVEGNHVIAQESPVANNPVTHDNPVVNHNSYAPQHLRPPHVEGFHKNFFGSAGRYRQPEWPDRRERQIYSPNVDPHYYDISQNPDGSRTVEFDRGCAVDTDGSSRHPEDSCWKPNTSLHLSNGQPLNTDKHNFVVLSASLARTLGVRLGDLGYLVDKNTGHAVPVVFGDQGPEGKRSAEASVHALKQLGYKHIDGNNGVEGRFQIVIVPHSGNGKGDDAAGDGQRIAEILSRRSKTTTG